MEESIFFFYFGLVRRKKGKFYFFLFEKKFSRLSFCNLCLIFPSHFFFFSVMSARRMSGDDYEFEHVFPPPPPPPPQSVKHYLAELAMGGPERLDEMTAFLTSGDRSCEGYLALAQNGYTPLMLAACHSGRPDISSERAVELLVAHSNMQQTARDGNTALALALLNYEGSTERTVRMLANVSNAACALHVLNPAVHPPELVDFVLRRALASPTFDANRIQCCATALRLVNLLLESSRGDKTTMMMH